MRPTMLHSGLEVIRHNINRRQRDLKLYEFGKTYVQTSEGKYKERNTLALYITGNTTAETWQRPAVKTTYYNLAGAVQQILSALGGPQPVLKEWAHHFFANGVTLLLGNKTMGDMGAVAQKVLKRLDVTQPVWYAELDWDALSKKYKPTLVARELSKFPEVRRDLSIVVDSSVSFDQLRQIAQRTEKKLLQSINVFDVYAGENLGAGKKSYSVSFSLQDFTQTLSEQAIDQVMQKLIAQFEKQAGALIRK